MNKQSSIPSRLLKWYRKASRDLPWRRTKDPYKIWVSEIMLQQTQVDTVIPYYNRWIKRFPSLKSLAKAKSSEVMKSWAGLGYYRRARMLHEASREIIKKFEGKFPRAADELIKLPGIGRYTAGAIASIAFGQRTPVLDGNVIRVLTRLFAISCDIKQGKTRDQLWEIANSLVPENYPGDFNQALMELGATVCKPDTPLCAQCPVSSLCNARKKNRATEFPINGRKEKIEKSHASALILRNNGKVLIQKQPETARWGGLWTFPHWDNKKSMLKEIDVAKNNLKHRLTLHHGFTRYQIRLDVYEYLLEDTFVIPLQASCLRRIPHSKKSFPLSGGTSVASFSMEGKMRPKPSEGRSIRPLFLRPERSRRTGGNGFLQQPQLRWAKIQDLEKFAFPSPHQKIVKELIDNGN